MPIISSAVIYPSPPQIIRCSAYESNVLLSAAAKRTHLNGVLRLFFNLPNRDTVTWNTAISACLRHSHPRAALDLFLEMLIAGKHPPDSITIKSILKACSELEAVSFLSQLHGFIIKRNEFSVEELKQVYTCLVGLYWDVGKLEDAQNLFDEILDKDIVAYTAMMTNYNGKGMYEESVSMFSKMMCGDHGIVLNGYAISSALHAISRLFDEFLGRQIHAHAIKLLLKSDVVVGTSIIDLYAKCGDLDYAKFALDSILDPTTASWNALMDGCPSHDHDVLCMFNRMRMMGICPDHTTLAIVLRSCKDSNIKIIQQLHGLVIKESMGIMDSFIATALFQNYIACSEFRHAHKIFNEIPEKDAADFNLGILEYSQKGLLEEAVGLLLENFEFLGEFNGGGLNSLVSISEDLNIGRQLHGLATKLGFLMRNERLGSSLMSMYMKFNRPKEAIRLFDAIGSPDLVSWTSFLFGLSNNGRTREGLNLYFKKASEEFPCCANEFVFSCLLRACADVIAIDEGRQIHAQLVKSRSCKLDLHVLSSLLCMYAECGYISEAKRIFMKIKDPDLALWNAMIHGMAKHGLPNEAMGLFQELLGRKDLKPNHITYLGILSACNHGGLVDEGCRLFRSIDDPSLDHYACMINMMARAGKLEAAIRLITDMPFEPNGPIWTSLLAACFIHKNAELGRYSAERLLELNPKDQGAYVMLSNVYAACNQWIETKKLRKMMRKKGIRKEPGVSWLTVDQEAHVFVAGKENFYEGKNSTANLFFLTEEKGEGLTDTLQKKVVENIVDRGGEIGSAAC